MVVVQVCTFSNNNVGSDVRINEPWVCSFNCGGIPWRSNSRSNAGSVAASTELDSSPGESASTAATSPIQKTCKIFSA